MKCSLCSKYKLEVRKFANNGQIPFARGICVDGKDRLRWVVDHLLLPAHKEALHLKQLDEAWNNTLGSHS